MGGPHQDLDKLWEDNAENPEQPFSFVVFHELNGGGVDDLATEESEERMRYYQPGVSGTPDAELDGGYIKLGGFSTTSIDYSSASQAVEDCKKRYERTINPRRPLQSLRNEFKFVELFVDQVFTGNGYAVSVQAKYLGMDTLVDFQSLRGSLYVFMIEDHVQAYSKVLDEDVINHNVFRGYAIKDQQFTLDKDETFSIMVDWPIPDALVPIKPGDLTAVAAVYDLDDVTSEKSGMGNDAQVPRCIQSATPKSTAYDRDNDLPVINDIGTNYNGELRIDAQLDDPEGISRAFVLYNTEADNSTNWYYEEMELAGEEVCDEQGVCYAYADSTATAIISFEDTDFDSVYFMILFYDGAGVDQGGLGAQGKSEIYNYTISSVSSDSFFGSGITLESMGWMLAVVMIIILLITIAVAKKNKKPESEADDEHDDNYDPELSAPERRLRQKERLSKKMMGIIFVIVLAIVIILSVVGYSMYSGSDKAPDFTLTDIDGKQFTLSEFDNKVVILDFMFTTCSGCIEEMGHLKKVYEKYKGDIEIITISISSLDSNEDMRKFKEDYGGDWIYARDTAGLEGEDKYSITVVPKTVIIDKDMNVVFSYVGVVSDARLAEEIDKAMSGSAVPVPVGTTLGLAGWAVVVGVGTFFSPCSFPLLPGYMSYYLGMKESRRMRRALYAGVAAAMGLVVLFIFVGIIIGISGYAITPFVPILEPIVGFVIVILGVVLLTNWVLPTYYITNPIKKMFEAIQSKLPMTKMESGIQKVTKTEFTFKDAKEKGYSKLFLYGMAYGGAAAGCTAPLLILLILRAVTAGGFLNAMFIFLVCALVMAILMITITMLAAASMGNLIQKLRVSTVWIKRSSGLILIIVGFYLIAYYLVLG
jgi:cytochrome c-type biogenesis protein